MGQLMGQHNNYYAKVYFLLFQSQDPSPPLIVVITNLDRDVLL